MTLETMRDGLAPQAGDASEARRRGIGIASIGVLVLSFDALLIRLANASEWNVVFWRGWLMMLSIGVAILVTRQRIRLPATRLALAGAAAICMLYGLNSALFVYSISHTSTANTVVILASAPLFAALFSWLFLRERISTRTLFAIVMAITGVCVIFVGSLDAPRWRGDLAAVTIAVTMGASLTLLRRFPDMPRLPLIALSGAVAGMIAIPFAEPLSLAAASYGWLALMGLVQIPLATLMIMIAPRYLPSAEVGLFLLIETVLGPFWVWLVISEQVPDDTLLGGIIILAAIAMNSWLALREMRRQKNGTRPVRSPVD
ncbi:DMT family transporter [Rhodocyclaceae bacterium SMB388]